MSVVGEVGVGRRVLLVEDEARLRSVLARYLRLLGHQVHDVGTAAAACDLLLTRASTPAAASPAFDVLVLDINLPDATGWEVLRRLQAQPTAPQPDLAVIVMTAGAAALDRVRQFAPAALLPKPFPIHALGRLVATAGVNGYALVDDEVGLPTSAGATAEVDREQEGAGAADGNR